MQAVLSLGTPVARCVDASRACGPAGGCVGLAQSGPSASCPPLSCPLRRRGARCRDARGRPQRTRAIVEFSG